MATAEAQFVSPGLPQTSLATAGERPEAVREPLLPPLSPLSAQTSVGTQDAWDGLSGSLLPLPPGASFPAFLHLHAQDDSLLHTATESPSPRFSAPVAAGLQQPDASRAPAIIPTAPFVGPAVAANTRPFSAGVEIFQRISLRSQPSPVDAALAVPWAGQAATTNDARGTMALVQEDTTLAEYDASPASRHLPASQERTAETMPSLAPLATDYALPLSSARATSHTPAAEPAITTPPSHSLEDMGRPWPRPFPANTIILHLEPRELGGLLLQVRVNDKRLIASFQAQSPEAETLLRSHLPSLQESLSQHGFEVQPIAITRAAEEFSAHMGAGPGAFAHQHSAFQAFAEDRQAANAGETQGEGDLHRTLRVPSEQRPRLLDVVI